MTTLIVQVFLLCIFYFMKLQLQLIRMCKIVEDCSTVSPLFLLDDAELYQTLFCIFFLFHCIMVSLMPYIG